MESFSIRSDLVYFGPSSSTRSARRHNKTLCFPDRDVATTVAPHFVEDSELVSGDYHLRIDVICVVLPQLLEHRWRDSTGGSWPNFPPHFGRVVTSVLKDANCPMPACRCWHCRRRCNRYIHLIASQLRNPLAVAYPSRDVASKTSGSTDRSTAPLCYGRQRQHWSSSAICSD